MKTFILNKIYMQSTKIYLYLIIFYIYPGFFHAKKDYAFNETFSFNDFR